MFLVLPLYESIRALFVFHFLIAGLGSYLLLRRWHYSRDLAIVGALLFSLGGIVVSLTNLLNHFQSAVWLPWLLVAWERLLLSPRWRYFVEFTLITTMQFLAGSPEITAMSMFLALVKGFSGPSETQASSWRIIGFAIAGNMLMLSLIMVQVLPTVELILSPDAGIQSQHLSHSCGRLSHSVCSIYFFLTMRLIDLSALGLFITLAEKSRSF